MVALSRWLQVHLEDAAPIPDIGDAGPPPATYGRSMLPVTRRYARAAAVSILATAALLGAASATQADPPDGWTGGMQAEFGRVTWIHDGWYSGARGNFHVGELDIDEDDDGITGSVKDWRCPDGVEPPGPLVWPVPETTCKIVGTTYIFDMSPVDVASWDHTRNRLTLSGQFDTVDADYNVTGSIPINVTIKGLGEPAVTYDPSPFDETLFYDEAFFDVKAWGRVNGRRVSGPDVTQVEEHNWVGFSIYGMVRAD